ncbi:hypothetical protein D9757_000738 [Collybiopsis confluens]|uniref:TFIIH p62 subunit N-terminal domain-containing protein n=1 Tax=Collybiopsis confluens TaxID=2823264 RepID=A0A8H5I1G2_9AGAR|nr:hypothetical protein D9757_000738 [Collybiopsis confluens]
MPTIVCTAKVVYKKTPGILELTDTLLQWTQNGQKAPSVRVPYAEAASLFCSKEGAPQVKLKIALFGDDNGHNFTFMASNPVALGEREKFKTELTTIIGRNRKVLDASSKLPTAPIPSSTTPIPQVSRPSIVPSRTSASRATSVSSDSIRATPIIPGIDPAADFRHRKNVFLNNPDLAVLHRELVVGGHITEAEFWEGREHLIYTQVAQDSQRKGKSGVIVDPRTETVDGVIQLTPQLIQDTFEQYPVVAKAHSENVPSKVFTCNVNDVVRIFFFTNTDTTKLSEAEFWTRYFRSKLFNAHRASIRSAATQHVVKDDPIFDKYLEKDDDELEPRRQRDVAMDLFVDLGATREDHEDTGNEKDVTMQAGKQKGALPLIRKGEGPSSKRLKLTTDEREVEGIDIEDLHDLEPSAGIALEMQDSQRYFEGQMQDTGQDGTKESLDIKSIIRNTVVNLQQWDLNLSQVNSLVLVLCYHSSKMFLKLKVERKAYDAALVSMTQNVHARLDAQSRKNDIPENLFKQMRSCQSAANEFLRHFWASISPPMSEGPTLGPSTPSQRAAKAAKMIAFLSRTHEKVTALAQIAQQQSVDPARVEVAMQPVLRAVDRALTFYHNKRLGQRLDQ